MSNNAIQRFSRTVEYYIKYRPGYPQAIFDFLVSECALSEETLVADIGSGTGLMARLFLKNGYSVIGIEPNDPMRQAGQQLLKAYPLFTSLKGTAEATPLPSQSVDLITVGEAFHWFEPLATRRDFERLLKPGGWVVIARNVLRQDTPFLAAHQQLKLKYRERNSPSRFTAETADEKIKAFFAPQKVKVQRFDNLQTLDYAGLKGRLLSASHSPKPEEPEYEAMLNELEMLFQIYQQDNQVILAYDCMVHYGQLA
jgi:SAM-dependent methyltransferase